MTGTKAKHNQTQRNKTQTTNHNTRKQNGPHSHTVGRKPNKSLKLFKDTHIKIAYKTWNTIQKLTKRHTQSEKYDNSGIYQLKCLDCPPKYIGQTGRAFHTRYKEHILAVKNNDGNSGYSNHILNTGHKYGPITDTMDIIKTQKRKTHQHTRKIPHTQIIQKQPTHERQCHKTQQPNIQNTT
jgi:hypothetical protein